jgi:hypothetical protein
MGNNTVQAGILLADGQDLQCSRWRVLEPHFRITQDVEIDKKPFDVILVAKGASL